jgi:hypothetical protein
VARSLEGRQRQTVVTHHRVSRKVTATYRLSDASGLIPRGKARYTSGATTQTNCTHAQVKRAGSICELDLRTLEVQQWQIMLLFLVTAGNVWTENPTSLMKSTVRILSQAGLFALRWSSLILRAASYESIPSLNMLQKNLQPRWRKLTQQAGLVNMLRSITRAYTHFRVKGQLHVSPLSLIVFVRCKSSIQYPEPLCSHGNYYL